MLRDRRLGAKKKMATPQWSPTSSYRNRIADRVVSIEFSLMASDVASLDGWKRARSWMGLVIAYDEPNVSTNYNLFRFIR